MNHLEVLARGRAAAEAKMTETITAGRFKVTTDEATGDPVRTLVTQRYVGKAEIKYESLVVSETETASQEVSEQTLVAKLPVSAAMLLEGDEIVVDASASDGSLVGRVYAVDGNPQSGQVTAHRYPIVEQP